MKPYLTVPAAFLTILSCAGAQRTSVPIEAALPSHDIPLATELSTVVDAPGAAAAARLTPVAEDIAREAARRGIALATDTRPADVAAPTEVYLDSDHTGAPVLRARGTDYLWEARLRLRDGGYVLPESAPRRYCRFSSPCDGEVDMRQQSCACGGEAGELSLQASSM